MPRSDAASSVVKHLNASEFEVAGFRVKRGMTINRRFFKKLNEYTCSTSNKNYVTPAIFCAR